MKDKLQEAKWPATMLFASSINLIGAGVAILLGADKTSDGKINPFFYTAALTSLIYTVGNAVKVNDILSEVEAKPAVTPEIVIGR